MGSLRLVLNSSMTAQTLTRNFERPVADAQADLVGLVNFLQSFPSGNRYGATGIPPSVSVSVLENATSASGTLTGTTVIATNTVAINGVTFTAVASGAGANQFNIGVSDTLTMANLAAAINASVSSLIVGYVRASAALTVVTVTAQDHGIFGNSITLSSGQASIVASAARLTGGIVDPTAKVYTF